MPDFQSKSHQAWWRKEEFREHRCWKPRGPLWSYPAGNHSDKMTKTSQRSLGCWYPDTDWCNFRQPMTSILGNIYFWKWSVNQFQLCKREVSIYFPKARGPWIRQKQLQIGSRYKLWGGAFGFTMNRPSSFLVDFSFAWKPFFVSLYSWGVKGSIGCFVLTPIHFSFLARKKKLIFSRHEYQLSLFCN